VLWVRARNGIIELNAVGKFVWSKIEDTYDPLRKDWFVSLRGLYIDSYKKIRYIDGYKINLINFEKDKIGKRQLVNIIRQKPIYVLSILEAKFQLLCGKKMSLDCLHLQLN